MTTKFLALFALLLTTVGCVPGEWPSTFPVFTDGVQIEFTTTGPSVAVDLVCFMRSNTVSGEVPCPNLRAFPAGGGRWMIQIPNVPPDARIEIDADYTDTTGTSRPLFCRSNPEVEWLSIQKDGFELRNPSYRSSCELSFRVDDVAR